MAKQYEGYVISQTHWDREWYRTFESFRYALVHTIDGVLDILDKHPDYRVFVFDGQTILMEDYAEIRPEKADKLREYCLEGRITTGPWYVMPDEFLVDGESLIRNLLKGHRIARDYGGAMKSGYVCDCFGHISQLPQILQGFDIDNAFSARGVGEEPGQEKLEFFWQAPDGSKVLFIHQLYNYSNASCLGFYQIHNMLLDCSIGGRTSFDMELAKERLRKEKDKMLPMASTKALRFDNGCDHMPAQSEIPAIINEVNATDPELELFHATYKEYADRVRELAEAERPNAPFATHEGEMRGSKYIGVLNSVFSSHMELKLDNEKTQMMLERLAEPLCSAAWLLGADYPRGFLAHAWKLLLQNHPHDSICGCSIDQVHREMVPRFKRAQQVTDHVIQDADRAIAERVNTARGPEGYEGKPCAPVVVTNMVTTPRSVEICFEAEWPLAEGRQPANEVIIVDEAGQPAPGEVSIGDPQPRRHGTLLKFWEQKKLYDYQQVTGRFYARDLPEMGYKTFYAVEGEAPEAKTDVTAFKDRLESDRYVVTANANGTFNVEDKLGGVSYEGIGGFENSADIGDGWYYRPVEGDTPLFLDNVTDEVITKQLASYAAAMTIETKLPLPKEVIREQVKQEEVGLGGGFTKTTARRSEEIVNVPVKLTVTLMSGAPHIDLHVRVDNCAKDHRLRMLVPTGIVAEHVDTEQAFDITRRSVHMPEARDWEEAPVPWQPFQNFVDVTDGKQGLAVAARGNREYEPMLGEHGEVTLAMTVFRAHYGLMGPQVSPDAQMQGPLDFDFALIPHKGDHLDGHVWRKTECFRTPPSYVAERPSDGALPPSGSLFRVAPEALALSAVKAAEDEDALIVRLWNLAKEPVEGSLWVWQAPKRVTRVTLNEEEADGGEIEPGPMVPVKAGPAEIVTLKLEF